MPKKYGTQHLSIKPMYRENLFEFFRIKENDISVLSGKVDIFHNGISDGNYAYKNENIKIGIKIPSAILSKTVNIIIFNAHQSKTVHKISAIRKKSDYEYSYFDTEFLAPGESMLLYFYIEIEASKAIYGYRGTNGMLNFSFIPPKTNFYQITVTNKNDSEDIKGIIYHIFVDRFSRCDKRLIKKEGKIFIENWDSDIPEYPEYPGAFLKNNTFFGGNLYGVIEKLGYLKTLGVSVIYLSPVFESPSNHKYDTGNYMTVDEGFGGDEALRLLIEKAKSEQIDIILDGVFNHTGIDSVYFNKFKSYNSIGAYQSKDSPYYNWYTFYDYPDMYLSWWGIDILPKINYEESNAENYFLGKNGVIEKWMRMGIRGFRLDVADELSDSFIERMQQVMLKFNKDCLLYGEVWEDASNKIAYNKLKRYYLGNELSGVMNYPLRNGIISYIREKNSTLLEYALYTVTFNMPREIRNKAMNLLGSHDTERILTALAAPLANGKSNRELSLFRMNSNEYKTAKRRLLSAYTVLTCLPGIPVVYYGDEAGVEGYSDPFNRKSFPWGKEDNEILMHYRKCAQLRKNNTTLIKGEFNILSLEKDIFAFERTEGNDRILTVYNNCDYDIELNFSTPVMQIFEKKHGKTFLIKSEEASVFKTDTVKILIKYIR